ncbi:hypothetical protein BJ741DRAFT_661464 [Chytriomyces cf. hyalinus JEL632]|nr:hypothetical protein BJ741DRAFT_661464 [Chytriomyces cf. hyalinus JEL632]
MASYADISYTFEYLPTYDLKQGSLAPRHEISKMMAVKLRKLEARDIVIICDDSTSMNTKTANSYNSLGRAQSDCPDGHRDCCDA